MKIFKSVLFLIVISIAQISCEKKCDESKREVKEGSWPNEKCIASIDEPSTESPENGGDPTPDPEPVSSWVTYAIANEAGGWGGNSVSNLYFAQPFQVSSASDIAYVIMGISDTPESVDIYTDNSGVPGNTIVGSGILGSYFTPGSSVLDINSNSFLVPNGFQVHFPNQAILSSGALYWVVIRYSVATQPSINVNCTGPQWMPVGFRKHSSDGVNWTNWDGGVWCTGKEYPINLMILDY